MDDADDDRRDAGPFVAACRLEDRAAALHDGLKACAPGVALGDRVGGDEAEGSSGAEEIEGASEEEGDDVGESGRRGVQLHKVIVVLEAELPADHGPSEKRRGSYDRIENPRLTGEELGKIDLPAGRRDGVAESISGRF